MFSTIGLTLLVAGLPLLAHMNVCSQRIHLAVLLSIGERVHGTNFLTPSFLISRERSLNSNHDT